METTEEIDNEEEEECEDERARLTSYNNRIIRFINHQHLRYLYDSDEDRFVLLR